MSDHGLAGKRIVLLMNIPAPTTVPSHNALNERCRENGCELLIIYDEPREPNRDWTFTAEDMRYNHKFATGFRIPIRYRRSDSGMVDVRYLQLRFDIPLILLRYRPDLVISGQMGFRTAQAAVYCKLTGTPLVIGWQGTPHSEKVAGLARRALRKTLVRLATHIVARSEDAKRYLMSLGAPAAKVSRGGAATDTKLYVDRAKASFQLRDKLRAGFGVSGTTLLFLGQFIERKGLRQYLDALDRLYRSEPQGWSLVFVGRGDLEGEIERWRDAHPTIPTILHRPVEPSEVAQFYAVSDVFVMPTLEDVWGNTCLEALLSGIPQLSSVYAGAVGDLLQDEQAGLMFDPYDAERFGTLLIDWVRSPPGRLSESLVEYHRDYFSVSRRIDQQWALIRKFLDTPEKAG